MVIHPAVGKVNLMKTAAWSTPLDPSYCRIGMTLTRE
jgi:hypothetical protein